MQCTGTSGCFPLIKRADTARRYTVFVFLCAVFSCFRNPPNWDGVHDHVRAYSHRVWAHRQRVSTTFLTRLKLSYFCLVPAPDGVRTSILRILSPMLYKFSQTATPVCFRLVKCVTVSSAASSFFRVLPFPFHSFKCFKYRLFRSWKWAG